jgi:transcriptional repressor NrdR
MMKCPFCGNLKTKVVDSRPGGENNHIRRRRHCVECKERFTTFERLGENFPLVEKRDGRLETFDRDKILAAIKRSCTKLPVAEGYLSRLVGQLEDRIQQSRRRKVRSQVLGDWVAAALLELHPAAYIRYTLVHRQIEDLQSLQKLLEEELG